MNQQSLTHENLTEILKKLPKERPIFHSEADFQFALAWAIKEKFREAEIRMERPYNVELETGKSKKMEVDIIVKLSGEKIGIELKYKTKKLSGKFEDEQFNLKNQSATPLARYDFYADIERLECLKQSKHIDKGFVIFLTNDLSYQNDANGSAKSFNFAKDYEINKNNENNGVYKWDDTNWTVEERIEENNKIKSIAKKRINPIKISSKYICEWENYEHNLDDEPDGGVIQGTQVEKKQNNLGFKYLMLEI